MEVKIDTKEIFSVVCPLTDIFNDNFSEELSTALSPFQASLKPNIVLNLKNVQQVSNAAAQQLCDLQQQYYSNNFSFVVCEMNEAVEKVFDNLELLELMNTTPTESEAWDIVQMEAVERELLDGDGDDINFERNEDD